MTKTVLPATLYRRPITKSSPTDNAAPLPDNKRIRRRLTISFSRPHENAPSLAPAGAGILACNLRATCVQLAYNSHCPPRPRVPVLGPTRNPAPRPRARTRARIRARTRARTASRGDFSPRTWGRATGEKCAKLLDTPSPRSSEPFAAVPPCNESAQHLLCFSLGCCIALVKL